MFNLCEVKVNRLNEKGKTNHTVSYTQHFVSEEFELEQMKISRSPAGRPASKKKTKKNNKKKGWTRSIIPIKAEPIFTSLIVWSR